MGPDIAERLIFFVRWWIAAPKGHGHWNRRENPEISPHIDNQIIFDIVTKNIGERIITVINDDEKTRYPYPEEWNYIPLSITMLKKSQLNINHDLNVRHETIRRKHKRNTSRHPYRKWFGGVCFHKLRQQKQKQFLSN